MQQKDIRGYDFGVCADLLLDLWFLNQGPAIAQKARRASGVVVAFDFEFEILAVLGLNDKEAVARGEDVGLKVVIVPRTKDEVGSIVFIGAIGCILEVASGGRFCECVKILALNPLGRDRTRTRYAAIELDCVALKGEIPSGVGFWSLNITLRAVACA